MNPLSDNTESNSEQIFFYDTSKQNVDVESIFEISSEGEKLRVKNEHVNCIFQNLDREEFKTIYNDFFKHLNLDFSPLEIQNTRYALSESDQHYLTQWIITNWMYYYAIHGFEVKPLKADFEHSYMVDYVLPLLDNRYGVDTPKSLQMGAHILRQSIEEYESTVKNRRWYYDR